MRNIIVIMFFMVMGCKVFSQDSTVVCGKFSAPIAIKIKFYEPVYGYYNMSFVPAETLEESTIISSDSFYYASKIVAPGTVRCYITNENDIFITKAEVVLFPGDSVHLQINLNGKLEDAITFTGSNAAGHQLFNQINFEPRVKFESLFQKFKTLNDKNKESFARDIDSCVEVYVAQFETLFKQDAITADFNDYYHLAFHQFLYFFIIDRLLNDSRKNIFSKPERDSIVSSLFKKMPVTLKYSTSIFNSYLYILAYYNFETYKNLNLESLAPLEDNLMYRFNGKEIEILNFCGQFLYVGDKKVQEDLWAIFILWIMQTGSPNPIEASITQYKLIHPDSRWNSVINRLYFKLRSGKSVTYSSPLKINFIDSSKDIHTLDQLLQTLPENKAVLIDIWATWCGPCISAFQYNAQLDSFLLSKDIERLYISLDSREKKNIWQQSIEKYALGGHHLIASNLLIKDLQRVLKIREGDPFSIPRYLLIDANKKVLSNNLYSPVYFKELVEQILQFLFNGANK